MQIAGTAVGVPTLCLQLSTRHDLDRVSLLVFKEVLDLVVLQPRAAPRAHALVAPVTPEQRPLMIRKLRIAHAAHQHEIPLVEFGDSAFQVARPAEAATVCAARDLHAVDRKSVV